MPLNPWPNSLTFHEAQQGSSKHGWWQNAWKKQLVALSFPLIPANPSSFPFFPSLSPQLSIPFFKLTRTIHTCGFFFLSQIRNEWNIRMQKGNVFQNTGSQIKPWLRISVLFVFHVYLNIFIQVINTYIFISLRGKSYYILLFNRQVILLHIPLS